MVDCHKCYVSGRVQGVFFRASAREEAQRLGVSGYAKNLHDGRVEVLMCGEPDATAAFRAWLKNGPPQAVVTEVECEAVSDPGLSHFDIR
ncbi:acylphosphatase [Ectothiorhodospiraceae bacterium WFHF3C12]|nr:acylphosphatase [Ectothiorhodospiraceae bacterium WFHF3C12]